MGTASDRKLKVDNYPWTLHPSGEVVIQTDPRLLGTNQGRVYLTDGDLRAMLAVIESGPQRSGNPGT